MSKYILFFLFLNILQLSAQSIRFDSIIDRHLKEQDLISVSVGIIEHGKIVYTRATGMANLETQTPAAENTIYKIGSLSKQFVATAIVKLAAEGKLSVQDPIHKYYPDAPAAWKNITLHHLLNHSSGLERESPAFDPMKAVPDEDLIKAAYPDTLIFATGTRWQYCNLGYFMLADIIHKVTGGTFSRFMDHSMFKPFHLDHTRSTSLSDIVSNRADGYVKGFGASWMNAPNYVALRPSGAFLSSIPDLLNWELTIQQENYLTHDQWETLWKATIPTGDTLKNGQKVNYGYGWSVATFKNRRWVYHGGALPGFRAMYYRYPDDDSAIIILCNTDHANLTNLANDLAARLFP